jgi:hypothetical protein
MRFCSRCGFPLKMVSQMVANGGALAGFDTEGKPQLSARQRGIRKGLLFMILSLVLTPIVALMTRIDEGFLVLFLPVLIVLVYGVARLLYAYLLEQSTPQKDTLSDGGPKSKHLSAAHRPALPSRQSVLTWRQPIDTSEMVQPLSVTDNTTKLLNHEAEEKLQNPDSSG